MYQLDPFVSGIILLVIGLSSILLILVLWRVLSQSPKKRGMTGPSPQSTAITQHDEAVLLVLKGGRKSVEKYKPAIYCELTVGCTAEMSSATWPFAAKMS